VRDPAPIVQPVFNIMWCLSGSSIHKAYPHMDAVIARILLEMPEAAIHFTGDVACQILEAGWENEPRVFRQSGEMSIRQTLALAQACDTVIGPETGVLNAVAFENEITKVVMLSHSSHENLTKHWANTIAIEPNREAAPCYPCHRLHYTRDFCPFEEETHAAVCAYSISPDTVFRAVQVGYQRWKNSVVAARELEAVT
jgi:ADP-heptose:LPS heptosyltransferase